MRLIARIPGIYWELISWKQQPILVSHRMTMSHLIESDHENGKARYFHEEQGVFIPLYSLYWDLIWSIFYHFSYPCSKKKTSNLNRCWTGLLQRSTINLSYRRTLKGLVFFMLKNAAQEERWLLAAKALGTKDLLNLWENVCVRTNG